MTTTCKHVYYNQRYQYSFDEAGDDKLILSAPLECDIEQLAILDVADIDTQIPGVGSKACIYPGVYMCYLEKEKA